MSSNIQPISTTAPVRPVPANSDNTGTPDDGFQLFGDDGFTFLDVIDMVNPLQQIPLVGQLYRRFTDDDLDPGSRVVGGALYFGPIGAAVAVVNVAVDETTGKDIGEHVISMLDDQGVLAPDGDEPTVVAKNRDLPPDPVSDWAEKEMAYRIGLSASREQPGIDTADAGGATDRAASQVDPVTAWAMNEIGNRDRLSAKNTGTEEPVPVQQVFTAAEFIEQASEPVKVPPELVVAAYQNGAGPAMDSVRDGRIADGGGWFSKAMLEAVNKSEDLRAELDRTALLRQTSE